MSKNKRLQIPINDAEEALIKHAAKRAGLTTAEWARRNLRDLARKTEGTEMNPTEALKKLFDLNAPISPLDEMLNESYDDRYSK